jgi:uncharacterized membrane protein
VIGIGLLATGFKLKKAYTDFSAVLVSGAIAILYFITYSAYSFYGLFPQVVAFSLMVLFTVMTIVVAMHYDRQVIAHIGLVGAYAVPFLLSEGSGNASVLFTYMAIINAGILIIAVRKYWKPLYYASFILTWMIFIAWYNTNYDASIHLPVFWTFSFIFFITFYFIFITYKLLHAEKFEATDVLLILSNSFIFYGLGYTVMDNQIDSRPFLGLFTLANAVIHFCVTVFIYLQKVSDRNLFSMVAGLVMVFITIAVPVQLDGSWVTLLWVAEAALLFWIGRMRRDSIYEKISYALILLSFASIIGDWMTVYNQYTPEVPESRITPILNIHFLTSLLFIAAFAFINYLNRRKDEVATPSKNATVNTLIQFAIPGILITALYFTFSLEISSFWNQLYMDSVKTITEAGMDYPTSYWNEDYNSYKEIWVLNYSLLFFSILAWINIKIFRDRRLAATVLAFGFIFIISFLTEGLMLFNQLGDSFQYQYLNDHYTRSSFNITIRYISFPFLGMMLLAMHRTLRRDEALAQKPGLHAGFDFLFHISLLCVLSNEWVTWMGILKFSESTRLGLSILWGVYALMLIILGIWKSKRHLRIFAIALFAVTLVKLAFYDITHLNTIAKTIIFVSLGILLLIISFLYNKYKDLTQS